MSISFFNVLFNTCLLTQALLDSRYQIPVRTIISGLPTVTRVNMEVGMVDYRSFSMFLLIPCMFLLLLLSFALFPALICKWLQGSPSRACLLSLLTASHIFFTCHRMGAQVMVTDDKIFLEKFSKARRYCVFFTTKFVAWGRYHWNTPRTQREYRIAFSLLLVEW